ncbi:MAG: DUF4157 domain-containing protein [Myxococcota bacterium]|nr:DUF4157 domain-containing protein [Myxococcota bacterium]
MERRRDGGAGSTHTRNVDGLGTPGRSTLTEQLEASGGNPGLFDGAEWETISPDEITRIDDVATAAVKHKDAGRQVDPGIRAQAEAQLGADLSNVRVHDDPRAQAAAGAMAARAFTYGADIFLGPGESALDLGLMTHELTHVVQQGAAGKPSTQRKVEVGAANDPAEHHADAVAAQATSGATPTRLLVDEGQPIAGQMLISQFLPLLRGTITTAVEQELGKLGAAVGCPWIDKYFAKYQDQPASAGEALLRRWLPSAKDAANAHALLALVGARVRAAVKTWDTTGQLPADLAAADPEIAAAADAPVGGTAQRKSLDGLESELGAGSSLDGPVAQRMSAAVGADVSAARIHTGPVAAKQASEHGAAAFAVGNNVVMGGDAPAPGTPFGDALLAHELAHVAQQQDAATDPVARRKPIGEEDQVAERDADQAAERGAADKVGDVMRTGLQLQRCAGVDPAFQPQKVQGPDVGRLVATGAAGSARSYGAGSRTPTASPTSRSSSIRRLPSPSGSPGSPSRPWRSSASATRMRCVRSKPRARTTSARSSGRSARRRTRRTSRTSCARTCTSRRRRRARAPSTVAPRVSSHRRTSARPSTARSTTSRSRAPAGIRSGSRTRRPTRPF